MAKYCWVMSTIFLFSKVMPSNVLPLHLKRLFEFSLKAKVMGSNPDYLLKYFFTLKTNLRQGLNQFQLLTGQKSLRTLALKPSTTISVVSMCKIQI